jgi:signal peptide peptidase SppA
MSDIRNPSVMAAFFGSCWAMEPGKFSAVADFLARRASGFAVDAATIAAVRAARAEREAARRPSAGGVAVLPLTGTLSQRAGPMDDFSGATSTDSYGAAFDAALAHPDVSRIVLDIDSPGGEVFGVQELHAKIMKARGTKPVTAVVNSLAASGAYWVASAADEVVVTPGGQAGSIGVFVTHADLSKAAEAEGVKYTIIRSGPHKVEGNPFEPLSDDTVAHLQAMTDSYYSAFLSAVGRGRGVSPKKVESDFGGGRLLLASQAVAAGMADRIGTLEEELRRGATRGRGGARAEAGSVAVKRKRLELLG